MLPSPRGPGLLDSYCPDRVALASNDQGQSGFYETALALRRVFFPPTSDFTRSYAASAPTLLTTLPGRRAMGRDAATSQRAGSRSLSSPRAQRAGLDDAAREVADLAALGKEKTKLEEAT